MSSLVLPAWIMGDGPDADIVVSTRARLARNLVAWPFPGRASREQLRRVADLVTSVAQRLDCLGHNVEIIRIDDLPETDKIKLVESRVMSPEHLDKDKERYLIIDSDRRIAIMVNEEDHLRIQSIMPGLSIEQVWRIVDKIDEDLGATLEFAYSGRCGYLTASITNVGTGMRISALMHLGGLAMLGKLKTTLQAAYELGVSVRGLFGEGTSGLGDFFQVSNEVTLGLDEDEIISRVRGVAHFLLAEERSARATLAEEQYVRLMVSAKESIRKLVSRRSVSAGDALRLLSRVRVACSAGIVDGIDFCVMNELLSDLKLMSKASTQVNRFDLAKNDVERASIIRDRLRNVAVAESVPRTVS